MKSDDPLVSVIVISYNSAATITETLVSIWNQSYGPIELIVSDDCSTDNTLSICKSWVEQRGTRFARTAIIESQRNSGIAANINKGVRAASGEWLKLIAADDILQPDCILDNMGYAESHPDARIIHSSSIYYRERFSPDCLMYVRDVSTEPLARSLDHEYQYYVLKWAPSVNAPTIFLQRALIRELNYYDETLTVFDDWPMWLKISRHGSSIHTLDKSTVCYRINANSISNKGRDRKIFSDFYVKLYKFQKAHLFHEMNFLDRFIKRYEFLVLSAMDRLRINRNVLALKLLYVGLMLPVNLYEKFRVYRF